MNDAAPPTLPSHRAAFLRRRRAIEQGASTGAPAATQAGAWRAFKGAVRLGGRLLARTPLYARGVRNALDLRLTRLEFSFPDLPPAFDGYSLLHLSDLHCDRLEGIVEAVCGAVAGLAPDLCVMTGDYGHGHRRLERVLAAMAEIVAEVHAADGILATLGNHDTAAMVAPLEAMGVRVLVNESVTLARGAEAVHVTGTDDVHNFHSAAADAALANGPAGFRIALVHSPEAAEQAARAGVRLYLAGHTHGGQVCLPGGFAVVTNLRCRRAYAGGLWRLDGMTGYTTRGIGVSLLPLRFNCPAEIALITLKRG